MPFPRSSEETFYIGRTGFVSYDIVYTDLSVHPVVYLKPDIKLTGTGTSTDPYSVKK